MSMRADGLLRRPPSLRELEVLRALVNTRKTTAAAQSLGISQPAISRAIAQLEGALGKRLFDRAGGRLVPTSDALLLNDECAPIFASLARIGLGSEQSAHRAPLRLAATPTLAHRFLAARVARFLDCHPGVSVQMEIGRTHDVVAAVAENGADLGFTDVPVTNLGVRQETFRRAAAHVILRADHALAAKPTLCVQDLAGLPFISLSRRFPARTVIDHIFLNAGVERRIVVETTTSSYAYELIREGAGVGLMNPFPLSLRQDPAMAFRPFTPSVAFETTFLLPNLLPLSPVARRFVDDVKQHQPDDPYSIAVR